MNDSYANYRWRKLFSNLWYHQNDPVRRALLAYACRRHPGFARVSLRYREQAVRADGALRDHGLVSGYSCTEPRAGNPG